MTPDWVKSAQETREVLRRQDLFAARRRAHELHLARHLAQVSRAWSAGPASVRDHDGCESLSAQQSQAARDLLEVMAEFMGRCGTAMEQAGFTGIARRVATELAREGFDLVTGMEIARAYAAWTSDALGLEQGTA